MIIRLNSTLYFREGEGKRVREIGGKGMGGEDRRDKREERRQRREKVENEHIRILYKRAKRVIMFYSAYKRNS
jgi:hypothetical protein